MPKKKTTDGFGVAQCSLCDEFTLTIGQQRIGGVRYCRDCIRNTLGWLQLGADGQKELKAAFTRVAALPNTQKLLALAAKIPDEIKKSSAIGESRRRLVEAYASENRD